MRKLVAICVLFSVISVFAKDPVLPIEKWETSKGLKVYYVYLKELPIVDFRLAFDAGSARDPEKKWGLAALTNRLIDQGTNKLTAGDIADQFAQLGTIYFNDSGNDYALLGLRSLMDNIDKSTELFTDVIRNAGFLQGAFAREKQIQLAEVKHTQQNPAQLANDLMNKMVFGNHPYGSPDVGTMESVNAIKREDVANFYSKYYSNANGVLVIVGAVAKDKAKQLSEKISLALTDEPKAPTLPPVLDIKSQYKHLDYPAQQTQIRIAGVGIQRKNPDYYTLQVANYILGGGSLVSRLMEEVREKGGLAYSVYSQFVPMKKRGVFLVSLSTRQSQAQEALNITKKVIENYVSYGPTEKELLAAKKNLTGSFPIKLDSNKDITQNVLSMAYYDLPEDYLDKYVDQINKVTINDVNRALKQYINLKEMVVVTVGKSIT